MYVPPLYLFYFLVTYNRYCVIVPFVPVTQVCIYKRASVFLSVRQPFNSSAYLSVMRPFNFFGVYADRTVR